MGLTAAGTRGKPLQESAVTEPEEDFAAMFEASYQAKRFERGGQSKARLSRSALTSRSSTSAARAKPSSNSTN